ncbi:MAG: Mpo1-like protein [Flavobacteriales bacterium]|nr:DUF962 domain-containing protein [Flavobacteriales bacterium]MCB9180227.1 DUF962 domain-containing protein [Flavobacteriales bacterium]HOP44371.1 DUF962 domain-containing protein [Flavobacteriales bacterium]HPF66660.1 DUF962 domain-containing protein [Flavobacteriales bacterium]HPJ51783.1 DUF962 domain-containing protein [Flavobacteriales bacterium]
MRTIHDWFDEYGESHRHPTNKLVHWVCVPVIFFSVIGLLRSIPVVFLEEPIRLDMAGVVVLLGLLFYLRLSLRMFLGMLLWCLFCLWGTAWLSAHAPWPLWALSLGLFTAAWIGQFIGHRIEGKKPSFLKDLAFLLIGPAWLMGFIYRRFGIAY